MDFLSEGMGRWAAATALAVIVWLSVWIAFTPLFEAGAPALGVIAGLAVFIGVVMRRPAGR